MSRLLDGIIGWSIHNRMLVLVAAVALFVADVWSASHASLDALPDFTPPQVVIQTEARGLGTTDVEELVTNPLERVLLGAPQSTTVRSMSGPGLSVVTIFFEDGVDIYRVRQVVAERLQLAISQLPEGSQPQLAPIAAPVGSLLKFGLTSNDPDADKAMRDLRTFADWTLRPRLLAIPGVSQVIRHGGEVERLEVRPDASRMGRFHVTLRQLTDALAAAQGSQGGGFVETASVRRDVQIESRIALADAPSQLADVVVAVREGLPVRVGDLADVVQGSEPRMGAALYDGRAATYVQILKLPWADTRRLTANVERVLRESQALLPPGARVEPPLFRQASFIETSVQSVSRAMLIGSMLVVVVLFAFLRHGRLAAITLTAIPLSILSAAAVLVASGVSINAMTLGGLAIAVGEVVDDAIVDVENVWRRLRENAKAREPRPALEVVRAASQEIRGSVVYATLIVTLVLLPVLLLGGVAGRIFAPLAQAYVLAIAASLVVALTVTPALCAWLLPKIATTEAGLPRTSMALLATYRRWLAAAASRPKTVFALAGAAALAAAAALPFLGGRFLPEFHETSLISHLNAVPGTSLDETVRLSSRIDAQLRPELAAHVASRVGRAELGEDPYPVNRVETDVLLRPDDDRLWEDVVTDTARRIGQVPGMTFSIEGFLGERLHEILAGETSPIVVKVLGPELGELRRIASDVARVMAGTPGLASIQMEPQVDVPQIRIRPDRLALARYGVRPLDLAQDVVSWRQGRPVTELRARDGRVVDVVVAGDTESRDRSALPDLPIGTASDDRIPLSALATIEDVPAPALIHHEGGERRIAIGCDARGGSLSTVAAALRERLGALPLPTGYRLDVGGEADARRDAAVRLAVVGALILLATWALLASAFASLGDATIVLLNLPLGLIGGVAGALLNPEGLSVAGLVGFVTLFGIIARNGIMLVAHKRHVDAMRPEDAPTARILRAAEERLLPILMTAATAGLGLLPLALSFWSRGSELEAPMALIVIGGLITSTTLNVIVLPTFYIWRVQRRTRGATDEVEV
jgi:CzcA family heavy metal efflux pump